MANPSIILVIFAATTSGIYKCVMAQPFSKATHRSVATIHAFTIETLQLLVLLSTLLNLYHAYTQVLSFPSYNILDNSSPTFLSTLVCGALCLSAIDIIDNLIQLRRFTHPVQRQTMILTRSWLVPGTVLVRRRRITKTVRVQRIAAPLISMSDVKERSLRRRRMSEPTTPTKSKVDILRRRSIGMAPAVRFDCVPDEEVQNHSTPTATTTGLRTPPPTVLAKPQRNEETLQDIEDDITRARMKVQSMVNDLHREKLHREKIHREMEEWSEHRTERDAAAKELRSCVLELEVADDV